jgi:hypothetical protein
LTSATQLCSATSQLSSVTLIGCYWQHNCILLLWFGSTNVVLILKKCVETAPDPLTRLVLKLTGLGFKTLTESMHMHGLGASVARCSISTCKSKWHHHQYVHVCILSMYLYHAVKSLSFHIVFFPNASIPFHRRKLQLNSIEISPPQR